MKRKLSFLLAFVMTMSVAFSSGFTMPVFAAEDTFNWAFWSTQPQPIIENIEEDTQNVTGTGTKSFTNIGHRAFSSLHSAGTTTTGTEGAAQIVTDNQSSKWCNTSVTASNAWFILDAGASIKTKAYAIRGAGDDASYTGRYLHTWTIQGSDSASGPWTTISSPGAQGTGWAGNYQLRIFDFDSETIPEEGYQFYRLQITRRSNTEAGTALSTSGTTMQFSYFGLIDSYDVVGFDGTVNYLYPYIADNPGAMMDGSDTPWNGENVFIVNGTTANPSTGSTVDAKCYTTIRKGLNIEVFEDTKLSYVINPQYVGSYDYKLTSCHQAIDLKFTDGTRLKDLGAKDYFGFPMTPLGQGQAKVSHTSSWNFVESNIGEVAAGKVIDEIIVGFEMPNAPKNIGVRAAFDDIKIIRRDDTELIPSTELADFADIRFGTRVGSYGNGACSPLVGTPNPFNYWVPCTGTSTTSPYNSQGRSINYIRISHIASRWFSEVGTLTFRPDATSTTQRTTAGGFHKDNETAHSYYYSVKFNEDDAVNPGVTLEVTPMEHSAVLRFIFPADTAYRSVQIGGFGTTPTLTGNTFTGRDSTNSYGMRNMQVYGEFNVTPSSNTTSSSGLVANFDENPTGPNGETIIELKVATSFMSTAQAQRNLQLEIDDNEWFDAVKAKSKAIWNKVFSSTAVDDPTASYWDLVDFYSKYARTCMYPTIMHENTAEGTVEEAKANAKWQYVSPYRGSTSNLVIRDGYFSYNEGFWDTFRSKWTALIFLRPSDTGKLFDGVVSHFTDQDTRGSFGIPRWIKPAGQNLMVMTSSDVIATELYSRGVDYDYKTGYDASLKSSTVYGPTSGTQGGRFGIQTSIFYGYTPWGQAPAAGGGGQLDTSWALEGFTNDGGTAKMAKGLRDEALEAGDTELARQYNDEHLYFTNRAKYYTNHFNATNTGSVDSAGWMMNKNTSGQWLGGNGSTTTAFNALDWGWGFCEDNAYQYAISVTQDGRGLANLYGGKEAFGNKLEHIFADSSWELAIRGGGYGGAIHEAYEKREVKIGQWGLSNEPGEHMQSMWLFSDRPEEAAKYTRMGMQRAGGSIQVGRGMMGEEDNGSMASWWVWAYIGLYPLDQGSGTVVLGSPRFKKVTFNLDDGRNFVFEAPNAGPQNCYVNGIKINGVPYNKLYFTQDLFQDGNVFEFDMSDTPSGWAASAEAPPALTETGDGAEFEPDILMDIIPIGVTSDTTLPEATATTKQATVTGITTANAAYLFDNDSTTSEATFTGNTGTITYYSPTPAKVEIYTLTSSNTDGADPKAWTLSGSNDGSEWTELDSRSLSNLTTYNNSAVTTAADAGTKTSETFRWRRQTKPFAIDEEKQGLYKYYRLDITASSSETAMRLSQFELLADQYFEIDKTDLAKAIADVEAIKVAQEADPVYGFEEYDALLAELVPAKAVYDNDEAIGREIKAATNKLNAAIGNLIAIRKAYEPFDAVGYNYTYNEPGAVDAIKSESTANCTGAVSGTVTNIGGSTPGAIIGYKYMDFGNGERVYTQARATYAGVVGTTGCDGAHMIVHLDSPDGPVIADINTPPSGSAWTLYQYGYGDILIPNVTGLHHVYIELQSDARHVANINQFAFLTEDELAAPSDWVVSPLATKSDGEVKIDTLIRNNTDVEGSIDVYVAVYKADDKLASVTKFTVNDAPSKASIWVDPIVIDTSSAGDGYYIKVFGWDTDLMPLAKAATVR